MVNRYQLWIPGMAATFATRMEAPWKDALASYVPHCGGDSVHGFVMSFRLPTLAPKGQPLDVDNLCEPVFSTVINELGWCGGRRPNLAWWRATKRVRQPHGLKLLLVAAGPPDIGAELGDAAFAETFKGDLPTGAKDPQIPSWLESLGRRERIADAEAFAVRLQFGGIKPNIGDIATGSVKAVIDCLHPLFGGDAGAGEDWRIETLQVEKGVTGVEEGALRIGVWKKAQE